ncbi:FAD-dependent monooxygenase [Actinoalloteichus sp. GBA129-24]|uniref:FAD-dependent monooxygenase n=1 Tax=Actinoalloteichus sp. GBA129-24 TaxID=1612551 RepID=UPI0009FA3B45|nr:FAD-dependent monooxygenase [Actinoalloteichus sp. GBA129-24]
MAPTNTDILSSGAGIAGPVLACMLRRHGFNPTVVDRMPAPGVPGVEADIYGPAVDVLHDLGVLGSVWQARTAIKTISHLGPKGRAIDVDITAITGGSSDRHIEIMRDDLVEILHRRSTPDVEHLFDDSIQHLEEHSDGVHVTFDRSDPREFHLVIGADGLPRCGSWLSARAPGTNAISARINASSGIWTNRARSTVSRCSTRPAVRSSDIPATIPVEH